MNLRKTTALFTFCANLFFSVLLLPASSNGQSTNNLQWGSAVNGLQMSVSLVDSDKAGVPELQFIIDNIGESDTILNMGMMLANGKVQLPDKISFDLIDTGGKTRKFVFFDGKYAIIAGRVDEYIIPLRSGSMYGVKIGLDKFYSPAANETASKLPSGKYRISAEFEGTGAEVNYLIERSWKGNLQASTLLIVK